MKWTFLILFERIYNQQFQTLRIGLFITDFTPTEHLAADALCSLLDTIPVNNNECCLQYFYDGKVIFAMVRLGFGKSRIEVVLILDGWVEVASVKTTYILVLVLW